MPPTIIPSATLADPDLSFGRRPSESASVALSDSSSVPLVPVVSRFACSYPKHPGAGEDDRADYMTLHDALVAEHKYDAHMSAYSMPSIPRRLATDAGLELEPTMVAFVIDVDGVTLSADRWKVRCLLATHPGGFFYSTVHGYRGVYLIDPIVLRTVADAARWSALYSAWLDYLERVVGIVGDRKCVDWPRQFRLPDVIRDGVRTKYETIGDPMAIGLWAPDVVVPEVTESPERMPRVLTADDNKPSSEAWEAAVQILGKAWPQKGRHGCSLALCGGLARQGWDEQTIADFVHDVSEVAEAGNGDPTKRLSQARDTLRKLAEGSNVKGWPTVMEDVPEDAVLGACAALGIIPETDPGIMAFATETLATNERENPITRDQVTCALKAAQKRLSRSANAGKLLDGVVLARLLKGESLTTHVDDDKDAALKQALVTVVRYAPRRSPVNLLVETLIASTGVSSDGLTEMILAAQQVKDQTIESSSDFSICERTSKPHPSQANIDLALRKLGVTLHYDEFSRRKLIERDGEREIVQDGHVDDLLLEIDQEFGFLTPIELFSRVIGNRARANTFHPVRDYLDALSWDGVSRIDQWLITYGGAADTKYTEAIGRLVLVAGVRRIRYPGAKFDEMLIIEGIQGTDKSSALKVLAISESWFGDDLPLNADTQRQMEATGGKFIVECGELRGMSKADRGALKAYLSRTLDESRMAYGREIDIRPRQFIVIGTTNEREYLEDPTGDRRFWPVAITKFDLAGLKRDRDQLWAEAAHYESLGESIRMSPELYKDAAIVQAERHTDDPFEVVLGAALGDWTGKLRVTDAWRIVGVDPAHLTDAQNKRLGAVMIRLGWKRDRFRVDGKRSYFYVRGEGERLLTWNDNEKRVEPARPT